MRSIHEAGHALQFGLFWLLVSEALRVAGAQGYMTIAAALVGLLMLPLVFGRWGKFEGGDGASFLIAMALSLFLSWAVGSTFLTSGLTIPGVQNLSVYFLSTIAFLLAASSPSRVDGPAAVSAVSSISLGGVLLGVLANLPTIAAGGIGSDRFTGAGAVTGIAAIGLAATVSMRTPSKRQLVRVALFCVVLVASLSRAYLVFMLICLAVPGESLSRRPLVVRWIWRLVALLALGFVVLVAYGPLAQRFSVNDGFAFGGITLGTTGRANIWGALLDEIQRHGPLGAGAGAAELFVSSSFSTVTQPHNDFIRMWYDFGPLGAVLWLVTVVGALAYSVTRLWRDVTGGRDASLALANTLIFAMFGSFSLVDNVAIYVFIAAPAFALLGTLVRSSPRDEGTLSGESGRVLRNTRVPVAGGHARRSYRDSPAFCSGSFVNGEREL